MKKAIAFFLTLVLQISLVSCSDTNIDSNTITTASTVTSDPVADHSTKPDTTAPSAKEDTLKWYAIGDSITAGVTSYLLDNGQPQTDWDPDNSWAAIAARINGWDFTNYGIGRCGYVNPGRTGYNARELVDSIDFSKADLVTLAFGINDWVFNADLGTVEDIPSLQNTLYANMKYCIEKISADNTDARIIVILPLVCALWGDKDTAWTTYIEQSNSGTLYDVWTAECEVCSLYGIEYVDLLFECESITMENATTTLPDGAHPSPDAHTALGKEMARKLKELISS